MTAPDDTGSRVEVETVRCLEFGGTLTSRDRQRRRIHTFSVPAGANQLRIDFRYRPADVKGVHNLLTLALFDPRRFRGAAHRWNQDQSIVIDRDRATPGFLPGSVEPGRWRIELDAHEIVNDGSVTGACEFALLAEVTRGPVRDGRGKQPRRARRSWSAGLDPMLGWYRGDLHSHSTHCDGASSIAEVAQAAAAAGLDFLATTGHNTISQWEIDETWPAPLLRIRGVECTTYFGHANVLGATDWIDWRVESVESGAQLILDQAAAQDALAVVNHPCAMGNPVCTGCRWEYPALHLPRFDGIEVWNSAWPAADVGNPAALSLWTNLLESGQRLTAIAGTDAHTADEYRRRDLPYTWVHSAGLSERSILQALRAGRVYISRGPMLSFAARDEAGQRARLPGDMLRAGSFDLRVVVQRLDESATLWLVADGVARAIGRLSSERQVVTTRADASRWWRLELRADRSDDLIALTNPVVHLPA